MIILGDKRVLAKFFFFCAKRNYVIYLTEVLGDWQMEIETEISEDSQLSKLTSDLSEPFSKQVVGCEILEVVKELKMDYFPVSNRQAARAKND